jgi:hypothetical protein
MTHFKSLNMRVYQDVLAVGSWYYFKKSLGNCPMALPLAKPLMDQDHTKNQFELITGSILKQNMIRN